ncbi:MAG: hypothetical protein M1156_00670 [Candidatus Marsarchaeota archaeon]|jgi:hypothetical protein|nr:hypothetical protein [Candidatus Marsarchaeota archaeon]
MVAVTINREGEKQDRADLGYGANILGVVRAAWRKSVPDHQKNNGVVETLEVHSGRMGKLLDTAEYEAFCVPNILEHLKYMSAVELRNYTAAIEKLGAAYKQVYGDEIAGLLLIGISKKARDTDAVNRYLNSVIERMKHRTKVHMKLSDEEAASLRKLSAQLYKSRKGVLRFLKKGEIAILCESIEQGKKRIRLHSRKLARYSGMLNGYPPSK